MITYRNKIVKYRVTDKFSDVGLVIDDKDGELLIGNFIPVSLSAHPGEYVIYSKYHPSLDSDYLFDGNIKCISSERVSEVIGNCQQDIIDTFILRTHTINFKGIDRETYHKYINFIAKHNKKKDGEYMELVLLSYDPKVGLGIKSTERLLVPSNIFIMTSCYTDVQEKHVREMLGNSLTKKVN